MTAIIEKVEAHKSGAKKTFCLVLDIFFAHHPSVSDAASGGKMTMHGIGGCTRRIFSYVAFALLFFPVIGISSASADSQVVSVGVYENAPKVFVDESGKPAGIFIEIIEYIAKKEGWELHYVTGTWGEGLDRLQRGEIDLMPDVAYTSEREKLYAFHKIPVLSSWYQVYARKGSNIKSIMDLAGKRVVVLERSVQEAAFTQLSNGFGLKTTLIPLPDYKTSFEKVAKGEADAAITNRFFGMMHARQFGLEDTAIMFQPSDLFFAAPLEGRKPLLDAIDADLTLLKEDSKSIYYRSMERWTSEKVSFTLPIWVKITGLVVGTVLLMSLVGSVVLKRQVNARTKALSEQNEQMAIINRTLRSSEEQFRLIMENLSDMVAVIDLHGRRLYNSPSYCSILGDPEKLRGTSSFEQVHPDDTARVRQAFQDTISTGIGKRLDYHLIDANGQIRHIESQSNAIHDAHGLVSQVLVVSRDVTERRQAEEAIRELNARLEQRVAERTAELAVARDRAEAADRIKSAFLATMSHELRTPLNSIIGFTGILLQGLAGPLNEEQQKQLRMVQNSSRHLLALINDVLDISKIEAGQLSLSFSCFELRPSIQKMAELVSPLAEQKGLELRLEIADDIASVTSDQRRLEQIILNLLNNAVKFTEQGHVQISCRTDNEQYLLSVSDSGIGIKPEEIAGLFQPFHQIDTGLSRKHEGTGLGLSICKKLIEMMGGAIDVQSRWGEGSIFTIRFPRHSGVLS